MPRDDAELEQILTLPVGSEKRNARIRQVAERALLAVAKDDTAPAAARAQAARTLAEMAGALARTKAAPSDKPPSEMTMAELDARIGALIGAQDVV